MKTDHAASAYMRGLIESNGDLGVIVRTNDTLDDSQKEQILAALRNRRNGCGTPNRPLLLWSSCEVIKPTISSADLQLIENRKFSRSEICAALGVPEEIVSTTDHNKYDVMQGARLNFIENRVAPLCARLEASEQKLIQAIDPEAVGWFDLDSLPIMQAAWRTRLTAAKVGFDMGIPFNELNRAFDLGFQRLPHGDTCYLPTNVQPVATLQSSSSPARSNVPILRDSSSSKSALAASARASDPLSLPGTSNREAVVSHGESESRRAWEATGFGEVQSSSPSKSSPDAVGTRSTASETSIHIAPKRSEGETSDSGRACLSEAAVTTHSALPMPPGRSPAARDLLDSLERLHGLLRKL